MNLTNVPKDEALDRALIQCLRLFAKHGRKIRCQGSTPEAKSPGSVKMEKEVKDSSNQETGKIKRQVNMVDG
jgi:hypothetical protein